MNWSFRHVQKGSQPKEENQTWGVAGIHRRFVDHMSQRTEAKHETPE